MKKTLILIMLFIAIGCFAKDLQKTLAKHAAINYVLLLNKKLDENSTLTLKIEESDSAKHFTRLLEERITASDNFRLIDLSNERNMSEITKQNLLQNEAAFSDSLRPEPGKLSTAQWSVIGKAEWCTAKRFFKQWVILNAELKLYNIENGELLLSKTYNLKKHRNPHSLILYFVIVILLLVAAVITNAVTKGYYPTIVFGISIPAIILYTIWYHLI
ncbi:MAG: hypothetical protein K8S56_08515 [Candidatus Cloacimonetes bacterium]|nr:hypothetical protein [Candidatus Cloacimonadota bacterium]